MKSRVGSLNLFISTFLELKNAVGFSYASPMLRLCYAYATPILRLCSTKELRG